MILRTVAFAVLLVGAAGAQAAPVLKAEVLVVGAVVTVGDMFEDAGILAELPLFRAPLPGTSGVVSLDAVRQAAAAIGLRDFDAEGILRVRVARDAVAIDEHRLTTLILGDLERRGVLADGITPIVGFDQAPLSFNAEASGEPLRLVSTRYVPSSGAFAARFLIAGQDTPLDVTGRVDLMVEAPHLVASLRAGTILSEGDIEMRLVPLGYAEASGLAREQDLVGRALLRQSRAGMALQLADVGEPELVSRNEVVTVYLRTGPMTLTVKGQALGGASMGEAVDILNLMSRKVLTGIVVGTGLVEVIGSGGVAVAGL